MIPERVAEVRQRIARAAARAGRAAGEVRLVAISKTFPPEAVRAAFEAGLREFGENRVQEAEPKIAALADLEGVEWHLVGHLQSNKARRAAELFDCIHSLDSFKLAVKLSEAAVARNRPVPVLLQVDLGEEETKFGVGRSQVRTVVSSIRDLPGIRLSGLMTMPPYFEDPEKARPFFAELRSLRDSLEQDYPGCLGPRHLSMGMSHDFEVAIQEGATIVRIGSAIFGERRYA